MEPVAPMGVRWYLRRKGRATGFTLACSVGFLSIYSKLVSLKRIVSIPRAFAWLAMGLSSVISIELVAAAKL